MNKACLQEVAEKENRLIRYLSEDGYNAAVIGREDNWIEVTSVTGLWTLKKYTANGHTVRLPKILNNVTVPHLYRWRVST